MNILLASALVALLLIGCVKQGESRIEEINFFSHSKKLSGSLVLPKNRDILAAVVFVHGSGKQTRPMQWAKRFAAEGIAAFVYDKRGVGESEGDYEENQSVGEKNINLLADDAAEALEKISSHGSLKNVPVGFAGISQAGWIIPIAAARSKSSKFVLLWSGPVCKVSEEDIYSKYTSDRDLAEPPTYEKALKSRTQEYLWPDFLGKDTDPKESLEKLSIPGLWIFGGRDGSIPVDLSILELTELKKKGFKYEFVLFQGSGHNNMDETFATAVDWIKKIVH